VDDCLYPECHNPNNCLQKCHEFVSKDCPKFPSIPIQNVKLFDSIWEVPGISHLSHGVDIASGTKQVSPLFLHGYCDKEPTIIQDIYRGLAYSVPDQLSVQPYPECSYSSTTSTFSSASAMSKAMSDRVGSHLVSTFSL
jgi:hypothetical protein